MKRSPSGRREQLMCCACHTRRKASNRSYCKGCWASRAREKREAGRLQRLSARVAASTQE